MRIVDPETGEEWDNEVRDYPIVEINGKKFRDVTFDAMESDTNVRPGGTTNYVNVVDSNTIVRIGKHWKKSKRIKARKIL